MASSERRFVMVRIDSAEWVSSYLCRPARSYLECLNDRLERQGALFESFRPATAVAVRVQSRG